MTVDEILNALDLLAYEAERHGLYEKEKALYAAATEIGRAHV